MRYAIADIHGCSKTFERLLARSGLRKADTLYLLGDYVDRGPDSCGVLTLIMELLEGGFDVRPLRGNHEEMMLCSYKQAHGIDSDWWTDGWLSEWGIEVVKSFGVKELRDIPNRFWKFLDGLPLTKETDDFIFVHASLDITKSNPVCDTEPNTMLWDNSWHSGGVNGKTIVSGHVVCTLSKIKSTIDTGHILLDNGCCMPYENELGSLVMLNLDTKELLVQPLIDNLTNSLYDSYIISNKIT